MHYIKKLLWLCLKSSNRKKITKNHLKVVKVCLILTSTNSYLQNDILLHKEAFTLYCYLYHHLAPRPLSLCHSNWYDFLLFGKERYRPRSTLPKYGFWSNIISFWLIIMSGTSQSRNSNIITNWWLLNNNNEVISTILPLKTFPCV